MHSQSDLAPPSRDLSHLSLLSTTRATAVEVHELVYGDAVANDDVLGRLYEPNAAHKTCVRYENPLITATSRAVIADIHFLTRELAEIDVPKPLAMFATLFGKRSAAREPWFHASRVWSELGDICESESFDANRTSIVEHTVHLLLLPGLHSAVAHAQNPSSPALDVISTASLPLLPPPGPTLALAGVSVPSPLHFKLRVTTRLQFNEQGRITHHRDSWDVRDVLALVPGMGLAQAVGTRVAALALAGAARVWHGARQPSGPGGARASLTAGPASASANSLGLAGVDEKGERQCR